MAAKDFRIVPAIDIIEGKCVRLTQGDYSEKKIYNENPLEVALRFEDNGLSYLHLVDLDGARLKKVSNYKVLETIASKTSLKIDFSGGIQSDNDIRIAFNSGAAQVTGGSVAVKNSDLFLKWLNIYGEDKIILGADVKDKKIAISGWTENSGKDIIPFIESYQSKGIKYVVCTDISKDGMLQGPSIDLYNEILKAFPELLLISSGGITSISDIEQLIIAGLSGAIIGKAIYEGKIKLADLKNFVL